MLVRCNLRSKWLTDPLCSNLELGRAQVDVAQVDGSVCHQMNENFEILYLYVVRWAVHLSQKLI